MGTDIAQISWIMTGFLLVYGVAIPFYGRLADIHGARRLFIAGLALFSLGSLLSAFAPNFESLLAARILQAIGGAAGPGLGMALASRAFGDNSRGTVIGIIGAVIGVGSAIGPLLGGVLASAWGWESIFIMNAAAGVAIPIALRVLPKSEQTSKGRLDVLGGLLLALVVTGVLFAPSQASQNGWLSPAAIGGVVVAVVSLSILVLQQKRSDLPFIPALLRRNSEYVTLVVSSFLLMSSMVGLLVGLPILLTVFNGSSVLTIGVVMLPSAILSAISGVAAGKLLGRITDSNLMVTGAIVMLAGVIGLSSGSGGDPLWMSVYAGLIGLGFGLVNTPLATMVTRVVPSGLLSTALGVNSMAFFVGGSVGAAVLLGFSTAAGSASINPFHSGSAIGFIDGFLALAIPVLIVIYLSTRITEPESSESSSRSDAAKTHEWTADCSMLWSSQIPDSTESDIATAPLTATVDG
jgi:DHA2 family metal-tetracycline-proton antiporter-like MFS transporter